MGSSPTLPTERTVIMGIAVVIGAIGLLYLSSFIYQKFDECRYKANQENNIKDWERNREKYVKFYRN